ncbi:hypothetical protein Ancab_002237 [Ancistrocladus abbreviatus]
MAFDVVDSADGMDVLAGSIGSVGSIGAAPPAVSVAAVGAVVSLVVLMILDPSSCFPFVRLPLLVLFCGNAGFFVAVAASLKLVVVGVVFCFLCCV